MGREKEIARNSLGFPTAKLGSVTTASKPTPSPIPREDGSIRIDGGATPTLSPVLDERVVISSAKSEALLDSKTVVGVHILENAALGGFHVASFQLPIAVARIQCSGGGRCFIALVL
jgi:hypothetical protein